MAQPHIQTNFASGEWSPDLFARVDLAKYHSAAALLRNFYVDYRGGVSTRMGTQYILQCFKSGPGLTNRLIAFSPSFGIGYALEFGQNYIRFHTRLGPVLENATTISGATQANPGVITDTAHSYANGDWIFISSVGGMTQLNGNFYIVQNVTTNTYTLTDLFGNAVNTTTFGAYTSGGSAQRVYTLPTPYNSADLQGIKYVQDVTSMILCHPNYAPAILTVNSAANWTYTTINFGPTISSPTGVAVVTTLSVVTNNWNYGYLVTTVDINNQESVSNAPVTLLGYQPLSTTAGSNTVFWTAVSGAQSYNVYKCSPTFGAGGIPAGVQFGFVGNVTGTHFVDTEPGITPNFSIGPPISENPFLGAGVQSYTITNAGTYTTAPTVTIGAQGGSGVQATAQVVLGVISAAASASGPGYVVGQIISSSSLSAYGVVLKVTSVSSGQVTGLAVVNAGSFTVGTVPGNPVFFNQGGGGGVNVNLTWGVTQVVPIQQGSGYITVPAVTFSAGAATATAVLGTASSGNPSVPQFFQERLVLAAPPGALQTYYMSQSGSFFNFNTSYPIEADDAITGQIIATELNQIRSLIPVPTGLIALTSRSAWLINGGGPATIIEPSNQTANSQAFNGASDLRPLQINFDILYGQAKGSFIRDLTYNFYANIYTGTDISILASHLFNGYQIVDWAWAEEPFKTVWAIRNDGTLLSLGFIKEQELVGWAHHDTQGLFLAVCSFSEKIPAFKPTANTQYQYTDSVYVIAQRLVNGQIVNYVERMADRNFAYGMEDAWCVDAALQTIPLLAGNPLVVSSLFAGNNVVCTVAAASGNGVAFSFGTNLGLTSGNVGNILRFGGGIATIATVTSGSTGTLNIIQSPTEVLQGSGIPNPNLTDWTLWTPTTSVSGLQQLVGSTVVGLGDGTVLAPMVVSAAGTVNLGGTYSKVTLGLAYTPQFQTMKIEVRADGSDTAQAKPKKQVAATLRVTDALGLSIGKTFGTLVQMRDLTLGNVPSLSSGIAKITNLYSGDARQILDPVTESDGQFCVQQSNPLPATILGVIPETFIGNSG